MLCAAPAFEARETMTENRVFKIDRSQRVHSNGVVVRVFQVVGTDQYGWDTNREQPPQDRPLYASRHVAESAADIAMSTSGHICVEACYPWRVLT
jgi:hypothetical protein